MYAIVDYRIPEEAKQELEKYAEIIFFNAGNIVYNAIAGHPDIFVFQSSTYLIVAPNAPFSFTEALKKRKINFIQGKNEVGFQHPETCRYNAVCNEKFLVHNGKSTDGTIQKHCENKTFIQVKQAYTRCNLVFLNNTHFICSDAMIYKTLTKHQLTGIYVSPQEIELPDCKHGFIGGTIGINKNKLFSIGNFCAMTHGKKLVSFIESNGLEYIPLGKKLYDGGGIFFIEQ